MLPKYALLTELAAGSDAVVTRRQLMSIGFSDKAIQRAVRQGRWQQLQRGVYLLSPAPPTWRQRVRAAYLAAGPDAQVSGRTLAAWLGLDGATEDVIELTVGVGKGPEVANAIVHRSRKLGKPRRYDDAISGTSVERLLVDYAAAVSLDRAERAVESALSQGLTAERRIWEEIARLGVAVPGVARLTRIMETRPLGKAARSKLEIELWKLIRRSDLPLPVRNHDVYVDGEHFEVDLAYLARLGAIEADSRRYHGTATQRARDRRRQDVLEAAGWTFVRVTWADVFGRPAWVIDQIRTLVCGVVAA